MVINTYYIWGKDEYRYPMAFGFIPNFRAYIHDEDSIVRPAVIVVPGGGYSSVSPTEGEIVALEFYNMGYNTFVLSYTTDLTMSTPLKMQPMEDLSRTIRILRKKSDNFHIDPNQITICGFSAGGHLCGSLAVHYHDIDDANQKYSAVSNRPDAVILCYPVITSGDKRHSGSYVALLGKDATQAELEYMSLEKQVKEDTPPVFLWHTATDETVPVDNTILFTEACISKGVICEQHIFSTGPHGLSLANEKWVHGQFGEYYTLDQPMRIVDRARAGEISLPHQTIQFYANLEVGCPYFEVKPEPNQSVALWPSLANLWLNRNYGLHKGGY